MPIDPALFPDLPWRWRVFGPEGFIGHVEATVDEVMQAMTVFYGAVDREYLTIDLL